MLPPSLDVTNQIEHGDGDIGELDLPLIPALPRIKVFHTSHLFSEPYYDDMLCDDEFAAALFPHGRAEKSGSGAFFLDLPINEDDDIKTLTENSF